MHKIRLGCYSVPISPTNVCVRTPLVTWGQWHRKTAWLCSRDFWFIDRLIFWEFERDLELSDFHDSELVQKHGIQSQTMSNEASWLYGIDRSDQVCVPIFWNGKKRLSPEPSMFSYDHVDTFFPLTMDELPTFFREVQILFRKFSTRFTTIRYFTMTVPTYFDLLHALGTVFWLKGLMEAYVIQYSHATYTSSTWKTVVSVCFPPSLCLLAWLLACLFVGLVWLFVCVLVYLFACLPVCLLFLLPLLFLLFFFFVSFYFSSSSSSSSSCCCWFGHANGC